VAPDVDPPEEVPALQDLSLWWDAIPGPTSASPASPDTQVDVCIVGAGFTGLWTAYALAQADPSLRIAVVEKEVAGFGASGRNGGWCSALFATSDAALARAYGVPRPCGPCAGHADTVDVVGASARRRHRLPLRQGRHDRPGPLPGAAGPGHGRSDEAASLGFGEDDLRWLDATEAEALIGIDGVLGATFNPHCAAIQPALLARGLADAVARRGVDDLRAHRGDSTSSGARGSPPVVHTTGGAVTAEVVVRAVEAWTPTLPGYKRTLAPVYSLMVATEPLDHGLLGVGPDCGTAGPPSPTTGT
jgi:glycine/D-amino acid oxidase-like deaminating enzyme